MKKMDIINVITTNNGMETETGVYTMTNDDFNGLLWELSDDKTVKIVNGENKNTHLIKSGKTVLTINIKRNKTEKTKTEKTKTEKNDVSGGHGVKSKNAHYIIQLKNIGEKPETITNITNCTDIKLWLKTINRKNIEYLRIYDMLKNECRKSAWIERAVNE